MMSGNTDWMLSKPDGRNNFQVGGVETIELNLQTLLGVPFLENPVILLSQSRK